ncbi:hypothetical protein KP509_10G018400 [Ceratopteris richardii]|nr:hypothetical protein KP509_10G018400 [Ceratopteris richardii]
MTWFGKPEVVGPINCARNGWVNVDADLIACEGCNAMLSFPCPSTWSQHEADDAAVSFSEKLESGHSALCPWKGNSCSEALAQFPPTSVEMLVNNFHDRCDALYQLHSLPVLSSSAIVSLKESRGLQMEQFLMQATSKSALVFGTSDQSLATAYLQSQRIISLCGWELRLLPYVVDCEEDNAKSSMVPSNNSSALPDRKSKNIKLVDSGPRVLVYPSKKQRVLESGEAMNKFSDEERKYDVGSAVLDCSLCGASVGLWPFSKIRRPSEKIRFQPSVAETASMAGDNSAASEFHKNSYEAQSVLARKVSEDVATSSPSKADLKPSNVLTLKLTIAGGPRPTDISQHPSSSSTTKLLSEDHDIAIQTDSINLRSEIFSEGKFEVDTNLKKHKQSDADTKVAEAFEQTAKRLLCLSSVNAVDTCFTSRPENSTETVEMPVRQLQKSLSSNADSGQKRVQCLAGAEADNLIKGAGTCERSNIGSGIEGTTSIFLDGNQVGLCDRHEGSLERGMSMEGSTRGDESPMKSSSLPESSSLKELYGESVREFDPLLQHRHFCPWVNTNLGKGGCGWQLTLDALGAAPVAAKSESASSLYNANPLSSVRKIFGSLKKAGKTH